MGLVVHVVNHAAQARSIRLSGDDRDDLSAEVFLQMIRDDFAILRRFRGQSSLATYLTVVARRIVVKRLVQWKTAVALDEAAVNHASEKADHCLPEERLSDHEEVERLLSGLEDHEAEIVRMYHLEAKSYQEISVAVGVSENSIGPILSRARNKMRRASVNPA